MPLALDQPVWVQLDTSRPDDWSRAIKTRQEPDDTIEVLTDGGVRAVLPAVRVEPCNAEEQDLVPDLAQLVHLSEP